MNFLIFRDFSGIFLIFNEFNLIYFELKINKKIILSCVDVAAKVAGLKTRRHMVMYIHTVWHTHVCARVCVCVWTRKCD